MYSGSHCKDGWSLFVRRCILFWHYCERREKCCHRFWWCNLRNIPMLPNQWLVKRWHNHCPIYSAWGILADLGWWLDWCSRDSGRNFGCLCRGILSIMEMRRYYWMFGYCRDTPRLAFSHWQERCMSLGGAREGPEEDTAILQLQNYRSLH